MKELRFHPQFRTIILTTAEDSFNIFRPNLDPDFEDDAEMANEEEQKEGESKSKIKSGADYSIEDSELWLLDPSSSRRFSRRGCYPERLWYNRRADHYTSN